MSLLRRLAILFCVICCVCGGQGIQKSTTTVHLERKEEEMTREQLVSDTAIVASVTILTAISVLIILVPTVIYHKCYVKKDTGDTWTTAVSH